MVPVDKKAFYKQFGLSLAAHRKRHGVTQDDLAIGSEMSRATIANIELGKQSVQLHQMYALAFAMNLPAEELLPSTILPNIDASHALTMLDDLFLRQAKSKLAVQQTANKKRGAR
jgi:transcriptional regulator with XRE-family HTH domain